MEQGKLRKQWVVLAAKAVGGAESGKQWVVLAAPLYRPSYLVTAQTVAERLTCSLPCAQLVPSSSPCPGLATPNHSAACCSPLLRPWLAAPWPALTKLVPAATAATQSRHTPLTASTSGTGPRWVGAQQLDQCLTAPRAAPTPSVLALAAPRKQPPTASRAQLCSRLLSPAGRTRRQGVCVTSALLPQTRPAQAQFVKEAFVQSKARMRRWAEQKSGFTSALAVCDFDGVVPVRGCYNVRA